MVQDSDRLSWSTIGNAFPTPILVTEAFIRHFNNKHLTCNYERRFWDPYLGTLADQVRRECQKQRADPAVFDEFATRLLPGIAQGLKNPGPIAYPQMDPQDGFLHSTQEVLADDGFIAVLRGEHLQTMYCPKLAVAAKTTNERWRAARRARIEAYALADEIGGKGLLVLPPADARFDSTDPPGYRTDVRFVSPEKWGFVPIREGEEIVWGGCQGRGPIISWSPKVC